MLREEKTIMFKIFNLFLTILLCYSALLCQDSRIKPEILSNIIEKSKTSHTDGLIIYKNGEIIAERYSSGKPEKIELMSATKSVVNLAIGKLIDDGKIKSLDQPVADFYPEWNQGDKKLITIRQLLNHTSGLQNNPNAGVEIEPAPDLVKLVLAAELSNKPGTKFSYNNKAVNLLAGIVEKASGEKMDVYFREAIFQPLGITDFNWTRDKAGNPAAMAGLQLTARDAAKFGLLFLNKGVWNGKRILSENWIDESVKQGQSFEQRCGLLWWRVPEYQNFIIDDDKFKEFEAAKVNSDFIAKITPLKNVVFKNRGEYSKALENIFGNDWAFKVNEQIGEKGISLSKKIYGSFVGYNADGYLGQYIVVIPKSKIVAVRQIKRSDNYDPSTDGFEDFLDLIAKLTD